MLLIRFIDLFTFPMAATMISKGDLSLWCGLQPFQVAWWCLDVAAKSFGGIFQH